MKDNKITLPPPPPQYPIDYHIVTLKPPQLVLELKMKYT